MKFRASGLGPPPPPPKADEPLSPKMGGEGDGNRGGGNLADSLSTLCNPSRKLNTRSVVEV
jgi:hypothetical protein